jgi:hypothetical protein
VNDFASNEVRTSHWAPLNFKTWWMAVTLTRPPFINVICLIEDSKAVLMQGLQDLLNDLQQRLENLFKLWLGLYSTYAVTFLCLIAAVLIPL